jgi:hypothetical protein
MKVLKQNDILVQAMWPSTKNIIGGKVVASPKFEPCDFSKSVSTCGSFVHQMCSNYALTNLLFNLCRFV